MTMALEVRAPAEQTEGTRSQILRWLKQVGDTVAENEPLIEIETDKVTVEVASPGGGVLREILKGEQEEIAPGEVLGRIETAVSAAASAAVSAAVSAAASTAASTAVSEGAERAAPVVGRAPHAEEGLRHEIPKADPRVNGNGTVNVAANRFSPAVRRLLNENAIDPAGLRGTGAGGRITVEDVLAAIAAGKSGATISAVPSSSDVAGPSRRVPHTAVRKRVAEHMVQSLLHTAPHVTTVFEADMTAVLAHRAKHRDEFAARGVALTLTAYFLQATVDAIRAVPEANSRWTESALEIFESVHIGVGTALEEGGLVVPVLRDVQSRDLFATAEGLHDLVARAREGRLVPAEVRGGTFTISNHGVSGSLVATPIIINQPQAAILGIGKLEKRPVVIEADGEDRVVIRPRCYVTLTIDHRVMDGHQANRFLATFVNRIAGWPL
jgi:2-oxoglutarate dehydrogenase E2 component (dihydrolipoamide succinyltransferase)